MRYTIENCPNTAAVIKAVQKMKVSGYEYRRRGRGCRFGVRKYRQSLPINLAARFTFYGQPKGMSYGLSDYYRFEYVGVEKSGKMRVRMLP